VVAVATSASGAVWHDVCNVLARRWPLVRIVHAPCAVQGDAAPQSIVGALRRIERWIDRCQAEGRPEDAPAVTILARGGGSLEDLWPFNDERVVRAVVAHAVPVVCGVGHETDATLADFAADVRAPTPSAAAELVVPDRSETMEGLRVARRRLTGAIVRSLSGASGELAAERRALDRLSPAAQLSTARERAGVLLDRATALVGAALERRRDRLGRAAAALPTLALARIARGHAALQSAAAALAVLGPQATLDRGYAIVRRRADAAIVREPGEAPAGTPLAIRVARGEIGARVEDG
jgi:exodeoxyribonuclease VII large subunit